MSGEPRPLRSPGAPERAASVLLQVWRNLVCWWCGHEWKREVVFRDAGRGAPVGMRLRCRRGCDVLDQFDDFTDQERRMLGVAPAGPRLVR